MTVRLEVATGGRPAAALARALASHTTPGGVFHATVEHDDGCPCTAGAPMFGCRCEIVDVTVTDERVAA